MSTINVELPGLLYRVAKAFNVETALKLADRFGGQQLQIPERPWKSKTELVKIMGPEVAEFLRQKYPMGKILIPLGPASQYRSRTRLVRQLIAEGKSARQIVKLVHVHQRTVEWNRQQLRLRQDKRQLLLFGS